MTNTEPPWERENIEEIQYDTEAEYTGFLLSKNISKQLELLKRAPLETEMMWIAGWYKRETIVMNGDTEGQKLDIERLCDLIQYNKNIILESDEHIIDEVYEAYSAKDLLRIIYNLGHSK